MESRLIYKLTRYRIYGIEWLNSTFENGAWIYIGNGDEMKKEFIIKSIEGYFLKARLYISLTRTELQEVLKENIIEAIEHNFRGCRLFNVGY